jgi:ELMO domain-containing protein
MFGFDFLLSYFTRLFFVVQKWFYRLWTGKGELERTLSGNVHNYYMTDCVSQILFNSKVIKRKKGILVSMMGFVPYDVSFMAASIVEVKKIKPGPQFRLVLKNLKLALTNLNGRNVAMEILKTMKQEKFDNTLHEKELYKLWNLLKPGVACPSRLSTEWNQIGFQGKDPATDFRGMGRLAIYSLVRFAERNNVAARGMLERSLGPAGDPLKFYPFACCGIKVGFFIVDLIEQRELDRFFYGVDSADMAGEGIPREDPSSSLAVQNRAKQANALSAYVQLFADTMIIFDKCWANGSPTNVMDFGRIFDEFKLIVKQRFCKGTTT